MGLVGRWIAIQSYKHDGTLHRWWDRGFVVENNDDYIVVVAKKAKVVENNGRRWFTKEPAVTIFSKKDWWNVICMFKSDGICYYCNIASPAIIHQSYVKYIDYDLDVKLFPDKHIRILDEKEFLHHAASYGYSDDLKKVLRYQTDEIEKLMVSKSFPFLDEKIKEYFDIFLSEMNKG